MKKKIIIDGVKLTPRSYAEALKDIIQWLEAKNRSGLVTYLNAYVYCLAKDNKELNAIISDADLVVADGVSIMWAGLLINRVWVPQCIMTKLFDKMIVSSRVPPCNCILIGVTDAEVIKAQAKINSISQRVHIVKAYSGYHDNQYYLEVLKENMNIGMVLIGMSSPKSEYLCKLAREVCKNAVIWHIGSGTIKCYAGTKKRAPEWVSNYGLEWIHRFIHEKHTRKRYLIHNIIFIYYVLNGLLKSINGIFVKRGEVIF